MDDSRIYLGVVYGGRNEGGCLLEDVCRKKIFLQEITVPGIKLLFRKKNPSIIPKKQASS